MNSSSDTFVGCSFSSSVFQLTNDRFRLILGRASLPDGMCASFELLTLVRIPVHANQSEALRGLIAQ
ncbi:hypothetical protein, partial [Pseudomonas sp. AB12(2023)]|uniref:hypothetical protein n=1 Tax=Pseudomonas sp. AB12(2023) TaxID=3048597 RepID=UPI002B2339FF